jgi:hypothetical protein
MTTERDEIHPLYLALFLFGGLCTGTGIMNLYFSFGRPDGALNGAFAVTGFSGLDDIQLLDAADFSIPLVVVGVCCLIIGSAWAWKETDGY